ncbi:hypothetical protein [Pseudomonas typographi]|uniref:hypothetical protein n=1 Tax=Pseudomonas typographi TaxID=2715964 RepID=UPI00168652B8|nr:hypothetical protein [Pseudomonas typographi]MBD1588526.1 hypothetical protein [Pseudomonas typographi]
MRITLLCRDTGGYLGKLSAHLEATDEVTFIDVLADLQLPAFLRGKLRAVVKRHLSARRALKLLKAAAPHERLLIVNPGQLDKRLVDAALAQAQVKVAYLCDGIDRLNMPVHALQPFDRVYTFDAYDAQQYGLRKLHNFIYEDRRGWPTSDTYSAFIVMAGKDRLPQLEAIAQALDAAGHGHFKFLVQGKPREGLHPNIEFFKARLSLDDVSQWLRESTVLVDIVRPGHTGLSFRFFEALLYGKKIITNNLSVRNYDFYNPANILVLNAEAVNIPLEFLETAYVPVAAHIVERYSMHAWASEVFAPWGTADAGTR